MTFVGFILQMKLKVQNHTMLTDYCGRFCVGGTLFTVFEEIIEIFIISTIMNQSINHIQLKILKMHFELQKSGRHFFGQNPFTRTIVCPTLLKKKQQGSVHLLKWQTWSISSNNFPNRSPPLATVSVINWDWKEMYFELKSKLNELLLEQVSQLHAMRRWPT